VARFRYRFEHRVNMGDYEHVIYGAELTADNVDDYPDVSIPELVLCVKDQVLLALKPDIQAASMDTQQADSFIHRHPFNDTNQ
jgi:hypothetical protein